MLKLLRRIDFTLGLILVGFSVWYISVASDIRYGATHPADIGPRTMPQIYGILLLVLSVIMIGQSLVKKKDSKEEKEDDISIRSLLSVALSLVYLWVMPKIGFIISSTFLLLGTTRIFSLKRHNWWTLLGVYFLLVLAVFFLFGKLFMVPFPEPIFQNWGL